VLPDPLQGLPKKIEIDLLLADLALQLGNALRASSSSAAGVSGTAACAFAPLATRLAASALGDDHDRAAPQDRQPGNDPARRKDPCA